MSRCRVTFGERRDAGPTPLYRRRVAAKLGLRELASRLGIPPRELGDYEWGRATPAPEMLEKIDAELGAMKGEHPQ